jgi:hypothetical protein
VDPAAVQRSAFSKFLDSREGKMCCRFIANLPVDRGKGIGIGMRKGGDGARGVLQHGAGGGDRKRRL